MVKFTLAKIFNLLFISFIFFGGIMKINYLGHASFLLQSKGGMGIVTDPYGDVGLVFPHVQADAVTISHSHFDHNNVGVVGGSPVVFGEAGSYSLGDVKISAVERYHDEAQGRKRGKNLVFSYEMDALKICHLGDIGEPLTQELLAKIPPMDVLLIPVGGNYTIDALEAKKYVEAFAPKIVIPMHYAVDGLSVDISGVQPFLNLFENVEKAGSSLEISAKNLGEGTRVVYMERVK